MDPLAKQLSFLGHLRQWTMSKNNDHIHENTIIVKTFIFYTNADGGRTISVAHGSVLETRTDAP
jgi:hypothetical protein